MNTKHTKLESDILQRTICNSMLSFNALIKTYNMHTLIDILSLYENTCI